MIKILNTAGGRPLKNDDLIILEQAIDLLEKFYTDLGAPKFIVSGCEITGAGPYDIAAGYIFTNGEIRRYDGAVGVSGAHKITPSDLDINNRTFFDSVLKPTAIDKKLIDGGTGSGPGDLIIGLSTLRLADVLPLKSEVEANTTKIGGLNRTTINIGVWDMDADTTATIAHSITFSKIRGISAYIYNDTEGTIYQLNAYSSATGFGGYASASGTNIFLSRTTGGIFDTTDFDSVAINRGFIIVEHVD